MATSYIKKEQHARSQISIWIRSNLQKKRRMTKEKMEGPTHMKAKKAWHALYPVGADDDLLRNSFLTSLLVFPAIS